MLKRQLILQEGDSLFVSQLLELKETFSAFDLPYFVDIVQQAGCDLSFFEND